MKKLRHKATINLGEHDQLTPQEKVDLAYLVFLLFKGEFFGEVYSFYKSYKNVKDNFKR